MANDLSHGARGLCETISLSIAWDGLDAKNGAGLGSGLGSVLGMALQKADLRATPFQSIPLYESFIFIYEKPDLKFSRHNSFCLLYVIPCQH